MTRLLLAVVVALGLLTSAAPAAPSCDPQAEMSRTLAELGEDPSRWVVKDLPGDIGGTVDLDQDLGYVDDTLPCGDVASIIRHEWMHLQQIRTYGTWPAYVEAVGSAERAEVIADCGSMLLGSTYTPYLTAPCNDNDVNEAWRLVNNR